MDDRMLMATIKQKVSLIPFFHDLDMSLMGAESQPTFSTCVACSLFTSNRMAEDVHWCDMLHETGH